MYKHIGKENHNPGMTQIFVKNRQQQKTNNK